MSLADDLADIHRICAENDAPDPAPLLLAQVGSEPLGIIRLRPFPRGQMHGPVIEAMALALPLGADRVSVALPGRAWSLDDPIPPVIDGADLRQRVLTQVTVDGHEHTPPRCEVLLHPFTATAATIGWDPVVRPGPGEGWLPAALTTLVGSRDALVRAGTAAERRQQAERLDDLGHVVLLTESGLAGLTG